MGVLSMLYIYILTMTVYHLKFRVFYSVWYHVQHHTVRGGRNLVFVSKGVYEPLMQGEILNG